MAVEEILSLITRVQFPIGLLYIPTERNVDRGTDVARVLAGSNPATSTI